MNKKLWSLILACGMLLSLNGCGKQEAPTPPAEAQSPDTVQEQEQKDDVEAVTVNGVQRGMGLQMEEEPVAAMDEDPDREIDRAVEPIKPVPALMLDGTALSTEFYYYRSTLDPMKQQVYDLLRAGMLKGERKIEMTVPVNAADIFDIYKKIIYDSPEMVWAETNGVLYWYNDQQLVTFLEPGYNDLVNDIEGTTAKLEAAVAEAIADMWSLPTQAEKAKYAHDYLTHHIEYTYDAPYDQTAYSAIVNGKTVCAGYTHAFQYMMQKMGIPCSYILGFVEGGYHAWNLLKLDGEHYVMDVTWDDPLGSPSEDYYYDYFNLNEQKMSADHVRAEVSQSLPVAEGTLCSYENAFASNAYGTDFAAIVGVMPEKIQGEQAADGNPYLS